MAATIIEWFETGAADGFNLIPPALPTSLSSFVEEIVPLLQARGLFRTDYEGSTLREHLALERPAVRRGPAIAAQAAE